MGLCNATQPCIHTTHYQQTRRPPPMLMRMQKTVWRVPFSYACGEYRSAMLVHICISFQYETCCLYLALRYFQSTRYKQEVSYLYDIQTKAHAHGNSIDSRSAI